MRSNPNRFFITLVVGAAVGLSSWAVLQWDWHALVAWLVACNAVAVPLWAFDKWSARRGSFRVPEATLHTIAFIGACPASLCAMALFRHKTAKPLFKILYYVFLVLQLGALGYWWFALREAVN